MRSLREFLSDPAKRRDYDASRRRRSTPLRTIVQSPEAVDFGVVVAGYATEAQTVRLSFADGSMVRSVQLARHEGRFWRAVVERGEDERSIHIQLVGRRLPITTPTGRLADRLRVQIDEVAVDIELSVTVKAASIPMPEPVSAPSQAPPAPQPDSTSNHTHHWLRGFISTVVAAVLVAICAMLLANRLTADHHEATTIKASGEFCSLYSDGGLMVSFFRTTPSATDKPLWSMMVPHAGDGYIAWWTPQFPYWERANLQGGFTMKMASIGVV